MLIEEQAHVSPDQAAIQTQLAKIVCSSPFLRSNRISDFLTFVVTNTLDGHEDVLKESCIGSIVFGRDTSYDPKIDPIVRVEARRLRSKLQEFYEGEGAGDRILITIPKGGYRAVIETREISYLAPPLPETHFPDPVQPSGSKAPAIVTKKSSRRNLLIPVLSIATACITTLAWLALHHPSAMRMSRTIPLTSYIGREFEPAISPDGRHLAFVWDGDGSNYDIYVKPLLNGDPVRLTTNPAHDLYPAWSPDGRDISFLRITPYGSQILSVPSTGGPERILGEIHSSVTVWRADASQIIGSLGPSWSPDGRSLTVSDGGAIYLWPLAFGERRRLTSPPEGSNDFFPAISPDGNTIAFVRQTSNSTADLYTLSLSQQDAEPRRITHDKTGIHGITWQSDGKSVVLSSSRDGIYSLWRVTLDSGQMEPIVTNSTQAADPSISGKSNILAYTELTENTNIWRMQIAKAGSEKDAGATRLVSSSRRNNSPQYSPDGQQIAFISDRSGSWELWISRADGSAARQLTSFRGPMIGTPHWSPDGQWIAFDARPEDHSHIFIMSSAGGQPNRISQNNFEERMPNWSHDGRYLYFNSNRSGSVRLWKMKPTGEDPVPITNRPAYDSFESKDGSSIYFRSDGPGLWEVPSAGGTEKLILELANVDASRYVATVGNTLYFVESENAPRWIKAYNFTTHKVRIIGQIDRNLVSGTPSLSVSPDERFLLYAQQDESSSDILGVPLQQ